MRRNVTGGVGGSFQTTDLANHRHRTPRLLLSAGDAIDYSADPFETRRFLLPVGTCTCMSHLLGCTASRASTS